MFQMMGKYKNTGPDSDVGPDISNIGPNHV